MVEHPFSACFGMHNSSTLRADSSIAIARFSTWRHSHASA
jgi:hypothetical protein